MENIELYTSDIPLRYELAIERIREIPSETGVVPGDFASFFKSVANWIILLDNERIFIRDGGYETADLGELKLRNHALYEDILPGNYEHSFWNPTYAVKKLGKEHGQILSALAYEVRSMIPFVFTAEYERAQIRMELFLECYTAYCTAHREYEEALSDRRREIQTELSDLPEAFRIRRNIRMYLSDYAEEEAGFEIQSRLFETKGLLADIATSANLEDIRYLYRTGEFISENEVRTAEHLNRLPEDTIRKIADTYSEGYRIGFEVTGKDITCKKFVGVVYRAGFERIVRYASVNFRRIGMECVYPRQILTLFRNIGSFGAEFSGGQPNAQYFHDHKEDCALVYDDELRNRKLEALAYCYREFHDSTTLYAGPAVIETFGEAPFSPENKEDIPKYSKGQQKLLSSYRMKAADMYNDAVIGSQRSFTIIAFPIPEIADTDEMYRKIFDETVRINTLDYVLYRSIQSTIIETLNRAEYVHIVGCGRNNTDLKVMLQKMTDPEKQTVYENCVADVNIPVGEVFTTPELDGTNGRLFVTQVYLNGLMFKDLFIEFTDGMVSDYGCGNFDDPKEGRRYIEENILFHHDSLPMGECAIGTNTTAYRAASDYGIFDRLPILIAEKTGPHFAVGDTCYSHEEDNRVYNPDGKEIIAKENKFSRKREQDPSSAYFGCHTDITIPYDEIGAYYAHLPGGEDIPVILNGKFVLPGTEELNEPLM